MLDQAYLVIPNILDEMLNFINSSFFQQLDFFDNLPICTPGPFADKDTRDYPNYHGSTFTLYGGGYVDSIISFLRAASIAKVHSLEKASKMIFWVDNILSTFLFERKQCSSLCYLLCAFWVPNQAFVCFIYFIYHTTKLSISVNLRPSHT